MTDESGYALEIVMIDLKLSSIIEESSFVVMYAFSILAQRTGRSIYIIKNNIFEAPKPHPP